jgi:hypothetical protein
MAVESRAIDIDDIPELVRLAEEVRQTGTSCVLRRDGEALAILTPGPAAKRRRGQKGPLTEDDPLFKMIGMYDSGIPGGVSARKHDYLARAYRPR